MQFELKEKLKKITNIKGFGFILLGIIAGLLFLVLPSKEENKGVTAETSGTQSLEYCVFLEEKAEALIKSLPEVKDCSVFITLECGYQYVYATDQKVKEREDGKETEKIIVLAENGNGENPILIKETMPKIAGVAVVCGNANYETQYRIVELISALFNIDSHRISVQT